MSSALSCRGGDSYHQAIPQEIDNVQHEHCAGKTHPCALSPSEGDKIRRHFSIEGRSEVKVEVGACGERRDDKKQGHDDKIWESALPCFLRALQEDCEAVRAHEELYA